MKTPDRRIRPGTIPGGFVKGKYAGRACLVCGETIPDRRPQWQGVGGMVIKGQYCAQGCWQQGRAHPVLRKRHYPQPTGQAPR
jgi:hypothetical protein